MSATHDHENYPGENSAILTPAPVEDAFGFYGTVKSMTGREEIAVAVWDTASLMLSTLFDENDPAVVRNFLRSRYGRKVADHVTFFARPGEYENLDVMHEAVRSAITDVDVRGRLIWKKWFEEIRAVTLSGEWVD